MLVDEADTAVCLEATAQPDEPCNKDLASAQSGMIGTGLHAFIYSPGLYEGEQEDDDTGWLYRFDLKLTLEPHSTNDDDQGCDVTLVSCAGGTASGGYCDAAEVALFDVGSGCDGYRLTLWVENTQTTAGSLSFGHEMYLNHLDVNAGYCADA